MHRIDTGVKAAVFRGRPGGEEDDINRVEIFTFDLTYPFSPTNDVGPSADDAHQRSSPGMEKKLKSSLGLTTYLK